ncbi:MAG: glycosyl hydrolase 53 family protein [Bacteroidetes bacterium]|nr:glycosyl hydrolase 53 family protein [Bacteroidota bacterium]MDA0942947.1 glycosyl hydrolase 53 family protein [Bacteroidota bacterium]MDA1111005.1 glycosyl hydrolase 53 family protein [Bacteroidota bacterium]
MRILLAISVSALIGLAACKEETVPSPPAHPFYTGMDLSYQSFLSDKNVDYLTTSGTPIPNLFSFAQDQGCNLLRFRLFHNPVGNGDPIIEAAQLDSVRSLARRAAALGIPYLLDFHYSDKWADPAQQSKPKAWENTLYEELQDSLYRYTVRVLQLLDDEFIGPQFVQLGNETNGGFLWEAGRTGNALQWKAFAGLMSAASKAVRDFNTIRGQRIRIVLHYSNPNQAKDFYDHAKDEGIDYDIVGLSYYPKWHGTDMGQLKNSLESLALAYSKPILILETFYPFTLSWNDWTNNNIGLEEHLVPGIPATPEGQMQFMDSLCQIVYDLPNQKGWGVIYWAPDFVAFDGPQSSTGSAFENICLFDFNNKATPAWEVFKRF